MAEVISAITGRSVGVLNDDMTEIKSAITGRTLYYVNGAGGGGTNPGGTPVTPITPATDPDVVSTDVKWQNGGLYSLEATADMKPILFIPPDVASGVATFELLLRQTNPVVTIDWGIAGMELIWADSDGAFVGRYSNTPPAFDSVNTEYCIVIRYYADENIHYANIAYTRELESI